MTTQSIFLFPGQGSQIVGMGQDLMNDFPEFNQTFEEASDALGFDMKSLCFEDKNAQLNLTEFTQPAILTVSTGICCLLQKYSAHKPTIVAGHSLGEYSALVALGALNFSEALKAVHFRGQAMQRAVPVGIGSMAAYLGSKGSDVSALCQEISTPESRVEVANDNCPSQLVLSGHVTAIDKICEIIAEKQLGRAKKLPVSAPFHSSLMKPAAEEMAHFFKLTKFNSFTGNIVANINAEIQTSETYTIEMLIRQIASPVLWTQTMESLSSHYQNAEWIEVGPGKVLQGLAKKTFADQPCFGTNNLESLKKILN